MHQVYLFYTPVRGVYSGHLVYTLFRKPVALRKALYTLLFLVLVPLLVSCQSSTEGKFGGYLYFAQSPYLMSFSMRDFSLVVVTHLGNKKIREISDFGEGRLLIAETASVNRRKVAQISWLDLKTGAVQALYSGVHARYIASADAIIYDDGSRLYTIVQEDGTQISTQVLSHKRNQLLAMVEVSNGSMLLEVLEDGLPVIYSYRIEDGTLVTLDQLGRVCSLKGAVWISDLDQLACKERDSEGEGAAHDYVFADLEGRILSRPALPEGEKLLALAYISDQGVLVLKESWRSQIDGQEKSAVWVHDVRSGENHELSDSLNLGSSVVYSVY